MCSGSPSQAPEVAADVNGALIRIAFILYTPTALLLILLLIVLMLPLMMMVVAMVVIMMAVMSKGDAVKSKDELRGG